jgi:CheY-like chemotaxis protein
MGGDISVESEPGRGARFRVQIPVRICGERTTCPVPPERHPDRLAPGQPDYRILVVDDNPENRALMLSILEPLGFDVREAENGAEAVSVWESWDPHLIWMDMRMPVMNGFEAVKRIKATTRGQAAAVIAMTASVFEDERQVVLSRGCDDYLRKPFRVASVFDLLEKHLGARFTYPVAPDAGGGAPAPPPEPELTTHLAALPESRLDALRAAIEAVDPERIENLLAEIEAMDGDVADRLAAELAEFRYDAVLAAIAGAVGPERKALA